MDPALKQRLVGAGVLVALAVIFLPMLVQGPAPDSGVADVPLAMPDEPQGGFETRDLPLIGPDATPEGGALGMPASQEPAVQGPAIQAPAPADAALPSDSGEMYPAAVAGGDYAVSVGSYSTLAAADAAVASLRASHLPGFREAAQVDGKTVQRVRIGPFATRAEAEAARQRASQAGSNSDSRVIALDADEPVAKVVETLPAATPRPAAPKPVASKPAPVAAADVGFAVQLAAFSKPADATALRDRARAAGFSAFTETVPTDKGNLVRVRIGPVASRAEAERLQAQVQAKLGLPGVVRPHP